MTKMLITGAARNIGIISQDLSTKTFFYKLGFYIL